jgi:lipopolysaccharide transport system ATP-binding protein
MNPKKLVSLNNVGVKFRYEWKIGRSKFHQAVSGINLDIAAGEKLGVVGRNGAGKSTLMRVLAGIIGPDQGQVSYHTSRTLLLSLQVGFQKHLTGRENAMLSGLYQGISKQDLQALMPSIQEYSELGEHFDRPLGTYSMGMKSRLGIATALNCHPELLILDEVFAVGDRIFKQKSRASLLEKINSDISVVIASHDNDLMIELCDRVLWLMDGKIEALGPSQEVLARYNEYCEQITNKGFGQ